jgi:cell division septum initiation protein DivIVA
VVSDTQHDEAVHVADTEAERDREREAREFAYHEVSLRAVELLASAQRAADEAVAEAQSYARDLEETAREQYRHILQRAHDAARTATGEASSGDAVWAEAASPDAGSGLDGRELEYVRTYARVAHTQLKAVLGALNDELDRLADLADGSAPSAADVSSGSTPEQPGVEPSP